MNPDYYFKEFDFFDGESFINFTIIDVNFEKQTILVVVSNRGKISHIEYDIHEENDDWYFTYGYEFTKIYLSDFND